MINLKECIQNVFQDLKKKLDRTPIYEKDPTFHPLFKQLKGGSKRELKNIVKVVAAEEKRIRRAINDHCSITIDDTTQYDIKKCMSTSIILDSFNISGEQLAEDEIIDNDLRVNDSVNADKLKNLIVKPFNKDFQYEVNQLKTSRGASGYLYSNYQKRITLFIPHDLVTYSFNSDKNHYEADDTARILIKIRKMYPFVGMMGDTSQDAIMMRVEYDICVPKITQTEEKIKHDELKRILTNIVDSKLSSMAEYEAGSFLKDWEEEREKVLREFQELLDDAEVFEEFKDCLIPIPKEVIPITDNNSEPKSV